MPEAETNVVRLFSNYRVEDATLFQRRLEIGRDIDALQDMSQRLRQMKEPLQDASDAFIYATTNETRSKAKAKLETLNALVHTLELRIQTLIVAMALHRKALPRRAGHG